MKILISALDVCHLLTVNGCKVSAGITRKSGTSLIAWLLVLLATIFFSICLHLERLGIADTPKAASNDPDVALVKNTETQLMSIAGILSESDMPGGCRRQYDGDDGEVRDTARNASQELGH